MTIGEPALKRWTYAEYLAFEEASPEKHELCEGVVLPLLVAMAGGTAAHADLSAQVLISLGRPLRGRPGRVYTSDLRVIVEQTSLATYPDVSVICGPIRPADLDSRAATNPTVLVEVLSPSTEAFDRGEKFAHYRQIPTLRDYVLVSSQRRAIEVFRRDEQGRWILSSAGPGERVSVESLGVDLVVDEIYEGVVLAPPTPRLYAERVEPLWGTFTETPGARIEP